MLVSIIIPVKNGADTLDKCLSSIVEQTIASETEIIIFDSESTDNSLAIATRFNVTVITVPSKEFNHGLTRNLAIRYASGNFLFFTVQDAYLVEKNQLERMVSHFADSAVMAITGMQAVPQDVDKNPALWFRRFTEPVTVFKSFPAADYEKLSDDDKLRATLEWDDVDALYRRVALEKIPFTKTDFAEDKLWARDALKANMKIGFDPSLLVFHYHHATFSYTFKLDYTVNYHYHKYFNVFPSYPVLLKPLASSIYQVWNKRQLSFFDKVYWSCHNIGRLTGHLFSTISFIIIGRIFGDKALTKSYYFFCKKVPQGKSK